MAGKKNTRKLDAERRRREAAAARREKHAMHAGEARLQRRRTAIAALSGSLTGVYEPGYLVELRQDWPD